MHEHIDNFNRMKLIAISDNNKYFLFEDKHDKAYRVYSLGKIQLKKRKSRGTLRGKKVAGRKVNENFDFEPVYEFDIFQSKLISEKMEYKKESK